MNQQKNASTHILLTKGSVNLSHYLEEGNSQLEEYNIGRRDNDSIGERDKGTNQQPSNSTGFRNETDSTNNPPPPATTATTTTTVTTTIADDEAFQNNLEKTSYSTLTNRETAPFVTANGRNITPKIVRGPSLVAFKPSATTVTPHQDRTDTVHNDNSRTSDKTYKQLNPILLSPKLSKDKTFRIHNSNLLDKKFKPTAEDLKLSSELEPLKELILSQHGAFNQPIQDLGFISLTLTKLIVKKKENLFPMKNNNKIPRSLRLKCELTTSPAYANNAEFLKLKEELQNEVSIFIKKGTSILTSWAETNIQLLIQDRCSNILSKALPILDGLVSYYTEIIGMPTWQSVPTQHTTLFLLKLYLSGMIFDISELIIFFELTSEDIMLTGTKTILNTSSDEEAIELINGFQLSDIDMNDDLQNIIIKEVLLNFDQILRFTTVFIWAHHVHQTKQITAANNLTQKIKRLEFTNASEATALAIAKATENIDSEKSINLHTELRLNNLEKAIRRQEQNTNETKTKNRNNTPQKNSYGSHQWVPLASPQKSAPAKRQASIVDLTTDKSVETQTNKTGNEQPLPNQKGKIQKRQKRHRNLQEGHKKSVQWKDTEIKNFNLRSPPNQTSIPHGNQTTPSTGTQELGFPPFYLIPTMQPTPFGQPSQNPFVSNPFNPFQKPQGQSHPFSQSLQGSFQHSFQNQNTQMQSSLRHFPHYQGFHSGHSPFGTQYHQQK